MLSPTVQISASGLTHDQLQAEQAWLEGYAKDVDSLDWSKWGERWDKDAFLQVGNLPKFQGKDAIGNFYKEAFINISDYVHHQYIRYSFDLPLGLIYTTGTVSFKIRDDKKGRTIQVQAIGVIHKRMGESVATGAELYFDNSPITTVLQEVMEERIAE
ncbi:unnamed protein product [Rhizoctonia solani]|uniref:SnoaL-like domain-containing protein n=1 Tax=Rhizoctonia solani TaxID=456999 RepID=A0A8H3GR57_9AGAM|nr:unnamed protein product [Rhizoctonia solani]